MLKKLVNKVVRSYNEIIQIVNFYICEPSNIYGHSKEFMRLKNDIKYEAHRVISPLALKYAGIEDIYIVPQI